VDEAYGETPKTEGREAAKARRDATLTSSKG
jgi:hypothetical protein